jgi:uncharacterized delta-60 repeat protein
VDTLAVQKEGTILVGGRFVSWNGQARTNLIRLNPDGSADTGFHPDATGDVADPAGVITLIEQADDKILVGEVCGWCQGALVRLNPDGSKDGGFIRVGEPLGPQSVAIQPDGKILITAFGIVARLNTNGTVDATFNPVVDDDLGVLVVGLAVQADGKILLVGTFTSVAGQARANIARLNPDGTLDMAFNPSVDSRVGIALQADGKIILCGGFTTVNGQPRIGLARLNADGSVDPRFTVEVGGPTNHFVASVAIQADGKILVAGDFSTLGGQARTNIGRLNNTEPATQSLTYDGSIITWLRGGTSPEVWRTTFEASTDGLVWRSLGAGQRISGGWKLTNISIPNKATIRARGLVAGGGHGEGIVEAAVRVGGIAPIILTTDSAFGVRSNRFGCSIGGSPGRIVVVEASTNLLRWLPLQTNLLGATPVYFNDPRWWQYPQQFYRVRAE